MVRKGMKPVGIGRLGFYHEEKTKFLQHFIWISLWISFVGIMMNNEANQIGVALCSAFSIAWCIGLLTVLFSKGFSIQNALSSHNDWGYPDFFFYYG